MPSSQPSGGQSEPLPASTTLNTATAPPRPIPRVSDERLRSELISVFSTALLFLFFLPWIKILGVPVSGLTLQTYSEHYRFAWAIPLLAVATLFLNLAQINANFVRRLAGAAPLGLFAFALTRLGSDLIAIMTPVAWIGVTVGVLLLSIRNQLRPNKPS